MYRVTICSGLFRGDFERERSNRALEHMLEALTLLNVDYLRWFPETPNLYDSGVFYKREPRGEEKWTDIPVTLARGFGDCEDLACWLAAEYRVRRGLHAVPVFTWRKMANGGTLYHILTKLPSGEILDPSKRLGMLDGA